MPRLPERREGDGGATAWFRFWEMVLAVPLDDPEADGEETETGRGPAIGHE